MEIFLKNNIFRQLVVTAGRMESFANRQFFEPFGLTVSTCKILALFINKEKMTSKEIIYEIGGTKANITQRLNHLEKMKLIKRCQHSKCLDKRTVEIVVTEKGKKKMKEVYEFMRHRTSIFQKLFNPKDVHCCLKVLHELNFFIDNFETINPDKVKKTKTKPV